MNGYNRGYADVPAVSTSHPVNCCCPWEIIELKNKIVAAEWSLALGLASVVDGSLYSFEDIARLEEDFDTLCIEWIRT